MARSAQLQSDRGNPRLKFLDRYFGIPLVLGLSGRRRLRGPRSIPTEWQTIGIMLTAGIGDTVVATGAFQDLRAAYPHARIVLFVTANNASFAGMLTVPDKIVELPVRQVGRAIRAVRAEGCDVVVDFSAWRRFDAVLAILSGAQANIGLRTAGQYRHFGYDVAVDHGRDHEVENDRRLLAALGVVSTTEPTLSLPSDATAPIAEPYAVFHLWPGGANFQERSWPVDNWYAVARALHERGLEIVLTGGPGDVDVARELAETWTREGVRTRSVAGGTWPQSMVWLRFATGVVSVNTGAMHVGAALGTPTIALNGPTSGVRWGPRGPHTRCVASPMVPSGYLNLGFERDDRYRDCMRFITVETVIEAWDSLMAEAQGASGT